MSEWKSRLSGGLEQPWAKSLRGDKMVTTKARTAKDLWSLAGVAKARKFSVAEGEENDPSAVMQRRKRRISSLSELPPNDHAVKREKKTFNPLQLGKKPGKKPAAVHAAPRSRRSSVVEATSKPECLLLNPADLLAVRREPIVSPIPLPAGVVCIDPTDDESCAYFPDFVFYLRRKEKEWVWPASQIVNGKANIKENRSVLMNWLLEVAMHFHVVQETLYHAVGIIDCALSLREIDSGHLQLVAITAFLIASKLEEYHPPAIKDLLELTDNYYKFDDVLMMERKLLALQHFKAYNAEPMVFINRFIMASLKEEESIFRQTCTLFYDCLIPTVEFSEMLVSKKAAAAVYAARLIENEGARWTPTLAYYSGYVEEEVSMLALQMIDILIKCLVSCERDGSNKGVVKKYNSRSRHQAVLKMANLQVDKIRMAVKAVR